MISLTDHLANLLRSKSIGLATVIAIADALAANARYNLWFYDTVKPQDESIVMAKLDENERLTDACIAAIEKFNLATTGKYDKDSSPKNLQDLEAALQTFAKDITKAMVVAP